MFAIDTNLLVCAHNGDSEFNEKSVAFLERVLSLKWWRGSERRDRTMESEPRNTKAREKKIEGMRKIREAYDAAKKAGKIKRYRIQIA